MKKYFIMCVVLLAGCASQHVELIKSVTSQYNALEMGDGITLEEAKVIAQRTLIKENLVRFYDLKNPKHYTDSKGLPNNERYWFISFREIKSANIEFIFMAIINKQSGKVRFADDIKEGKEWILEAALLGG